MRPRGVQNECQNYSPRRELHLTIDESIHLFDNSELLAKAVTMGKSLASLYFMSFIRDSILLLPVDMDDISNLLIFKNKNLALNALLLNIFYPSNSSPKGAEWEFFHIFKKYLMNLKSMGMMPVSLFYHNGPSKAWAGLTRLGGLRLFFSTVLLKI